MASSSRWLSCVQFNNICAWIERPVLRHGDLLNMYFLHSHLVNNDHRMLTNNINIHIHVCTLVCSITLTHHCYLSIIPLRCGQTIRFSIRFFSSDSLWTKIVLCHHLSRKLKAKSEVDWKSEVRSIFNRLSGEIMTSQWRFPVQQNHWIGFINHHCYFSISTEIKVLSEILIPD